MKKAILIAAACMLALTATAQDRLIDYVNPFVGTGGFGSC